MAEKKKRKPLRDINKDGKKNFADTWLGDALGLDGKVGVQGPGLKKSLKGARRGEEPKKKTEEKKSTPSRKRREPAMAMPTSDSKAERSRRGLDRPVAPTSNPKAEQARRSLDMPEAGAKNLLRAPERAGPKTTAQARAETIRQGAAEKAQPNKQKFMQEFSRTPEGIRLIQSGVTGQALKDKAMEAYNKKYGMAKGGMARYQKGGMVDYKSTGLFYDSKSPRGYS